MRSTSVPVPRHSSSMSEFGSGLAQFIVVFRFLGFLEKCEIGFGEDETERAWMDLVGLESKEFGSRRRVVTDIFFVCCLLL